MGLWVPSTAKLKKEDFRKWEVKYCEKWVLVTFQSLSPSPLSMDFLAYTSTEYIYVEANPK